MKLDTDFTKIKTDGDFREASLDLFYYQAHHNSVYSAYLSLIGKKTEDVKDVDQIPFLPIQFFKYKQVIVDNTIPQYIFTSSGTGRSGASKHYIADINLYEQSFMTGFRHFYGEPGKYCFLALLPSYHEQEQSSLLYMVRTLIASSPHEQSGFYLNNYEALIQNLQFTRKQNIPVILFGVSFALLELAEQYKINLDHCTIIETGGMKGRRKELTREELHTYLCDRFNVFRIHSEYGMTELLSQAYSMGNGIFNTPPWMKVFIRDPYDPISYVSP